MSSRPLLQQDDLVLHTESTAHHANLDCWNHNRCYKLLGWFAGRTEISIIYIPGVTKLGVSGVKNESLSRHEALFVLKGMCISRNIACVASVIHFNYLVPAALPSFDEKTVDLFGRFSSLVGLLLGFMADLDEHLNLQEAMKVEQAGWCLPVPIMMVREWAKSMSAFAGFCMQHFLICCRLRLECKIATCRMTLPSWEACFNSEGQYNEDMGAKVLLGKVTTIVASHNDVHTTMSAMSNASRQFQISPPLALHETPAECIAVAKTVLSSATTASVICHGAELLQKHKHHPMCHKIAKEFLHKHQNKNLPVPASFWHEFETMASHATSAKIFRSPMAKGTLDTIDDNSTSTSTRSPASKRPAPSSSSASSPATASSPSAKTSMPPPPRPPIATLACAILRRASRRNGHEHLAQCSSRVVALSASRTSMQALPAASRKACSMPHAHAS